MTTIVEEARAASAGRPTGLLSRPVLSWALYDLANTIFSMNIVSFFFGIWVVRVMGATDSHLAYASSVSMGFIFLLSPFLGALSDQAPRRMPFLIASTTIAVGSTLLLGTAGLLASLVCFAIGKFAYEAGLQFYDALLPEVSTEENRGRVGGFGIGLGYVGSLLGLLLARWVLGDADSLPQAEQTERYVRVFQMTGALFLLFSIPCFLFVRERVRAHRRFSLASVGAAGRQVLGTLRSTGRYPGLLRFLVGRVFYTDSVNTVILFMTIYVTTEVGFSVPQAMTVMLVATAFAVVGGFAWGRLVDRIGPKRTLDLVLGLWTVVFLWTALVGFLKLPQLAFWPVPLLAGLALGGTWAADRPYMLRLTPPARVGEFYGLYGMVGRFSHMIGPLVWALVVDTLGLGRPAAVLTLLLGIVIAYLILRGVSDAPRDWPEEERVGPVPAG